MCHCFDEFIPIVPFKQYMDRIHRIHHCDNGVIPIVPFKQYMDRIHRIHHCGNGLCMCHCFGGHINIVQFKQYLDGIYRIHHCDNGTDYTRRIVHKQHESQRKTGKKQQLIGIIRHHADMRPIRNVSRLSLVQ